MPCQLFVTSVLHIVSYVIHMNYASKLLASSKITHFWLLAHKVVLSNVVIKIVRVRINAVMFIFFEADVTVTIIGYTLSCGFPQTVLFG